MSLPTGSRPLGQQPVPASPAAQHVPQHVPQSGPPLGRDVPPAGYAPPPAAAPAAGAPGAVPITPRDGDERRRKAPLAWLPWALLAALLGLLALMLLAGAVAGTDVARPAGSAGTAAGDATDLSAPGAGAAGGGERGGAAAGALSAGDVDVLATPQDLARLGSLQGRPAVGRAVVVESVVADEGFWVGSSPAQRAFVFLTPEARQSAGESGFQVRKGQRVDLNGSVTATSEGDAARFGVTDAEGARQLTQQRAYVRATQVRLTDS